MRYGLTICHYGSDYIGYAIKSIYPFCDKVFVMYARQPSHGRRVEIACPDSRIMLQNAVSQQLGSWDKIEWIDGNWTSEGEQRSEIWNCVAPDSTIIVADADEIWNYEILDNMLMYSEELKGNFRMRATLITYWKSFNWICEDAMQPVRLIRGKELGPELYQPVKGIAINHFGYARKNIDIAYKWAIHGHLPELRENWYDNVYKKWNPKQPFNDVHPTCVGIWNPRKIEKDKFVPPIMKTHPYYDLEVIK